MVKSWGVTIVLLAAVTLGAAATAFAQPAPIAVSTFDTNDEGWMVVSTGDPPHYAPPHYSPTGGNPGGYIYDTDMDGGGWGFEAPDKFRGDIRAAYGHELSFDFLTDRIGQDVETFPIVFSKADFVGIITYVPVPSTTYVIEHRDVLIHETTEWYNFEYQSGEQGTPADENDILDVLASVRYLFMGAEFCPGYDGDGTYEYGELVAYDNVILMPEPAMLSLLALGGLAVVRRKRS